MPTEATGFFVPGGLSRPERMATPNWPLFAAAVSVLTLALLVLSRLSARAIATAEPPERDDPVSESAAGSPDEAGGHLPARGHLPTGLALLANVALTHGLLALATLGIVWVAAVPVSALGLAVPEGRHVAIGLGLGVGLYLASETASAVGAELGVVFDERLRGLLSPESRPQWAALLFLVLPVVVVAEELLFRGVLIGAVAVGFGVPAWALVAGSSVLFGLGHSAQGGAGIAVTGALGLLLGAVFAWTGSLVTVVVAHYVVDLLEFAVREWLLGGRAGLGR